MNSIICQVQILSQIPTKTLLITRPLLEEWGIQPSETIQIELGNKTATVKVVASRNSGAQIYLSSAIARQLALPYTGTTRAAFDQTKLKLGPVIGILTTGFTGNPEMPFGSRSILFRQFLVAGASEKPYFFVFTPEMIDWSKKTVKGWYYKNQRWQAFTSPLPDVIYERVPNRKAESAQHVRLCLLRLRESSQCQIFNQGFFNKWSVHQLLSNHPRTAQYIPESYLSPSLSTLSQILEKHHMVYLKPISGSLGLGIFRITRHPKEGYFCRFHQGERNVLHRFRTLEKLISHYFGNNLERFKRYMVQQGIRLIKVNHRPVDFRVHLHKDITGQWKVIGIGTKAAGFGCVTTHVRTGGEILSTDDFLKSAFKEHSDHMRRKLEQAAIDIAETLEIQLSGPLGELGLDMGIDRNWQIWMFECNAKPGRHIFHHPSLKEAGRKSAKCITEYSLKLADFV
jgi:hypothetical protein